MKINIFSARAFFLQTHSSHNICINEKYRFLSRKYFVTKLRLRMISSLCARGKTEARHSGVNTYALAIGSDKCKQKQSNLIGRG